MRILMTGGTGFVGTILTGAFCREGHRVTVLTRRIPSDRALPAGASYMEADPVRPGKWQEAVPEHDVIVNLAGSSIFRRWTDKAKKSMKDSRLFTTRNLVQALAGPGGKNKVLLSTSAVGYYGSRGDKELDEDSGPDAGFLGNLAREWEEAAAEAGDFGVRVVLIRSGIVLGKHGGALDKMVPPFKWWLGSPLGTGKQWFSWIHEEDLSRIYLFLLATENASGPVNCTSPNPVRNSELTAALGKAVGKPTFLPAVPEWVLKLALGEFSSVLLQGQRVLPKQLQEMGFQFHHPEIGEALRDLAG